MILEKRSTIKDLNQFANEFLTQQKSEDNKVLAKTSEEALGGAQDIYAERVAETAELRSKAREISFKTGLLLSRCTLDDDTLDKELENNKKSKFAKFQNYFSYQESVEQAVAHRVMAIRRGEAEKVLRLSIEVEKDEILDVFKKDLITSVETTEEVSLWLEKAISDSYRRLIGPSIETEIRLHKNRAEEEAIKVFQKI